jgi:hypothetical protein
MASVAGCRRVPEPPARMMPLRGVVMVQKIKSCQRLLDQGWSQF